MPVTTLVKFYKNIIPLFGMKSDKKGAMLYASPFDDSTSPINITINRHKKQMVLPYKRYLSDLDEYQVFHPLTEDVTMGMSPVIRLTSASCNHYYNNLVTGILYNILEIASDANLQKGLKNKCLEYLQFIPNIKTTDLRKAIKVLETINEAKKDHVIYIQPTSNKILLKDTNYHRITIVSSPAHDTLEKIINGSTTSIGGVNISKRLANILKAAIEAVLPGIADDKRSYTRGASIKVAPYFKSLSLAMGALAHDLNDVITSFNFDDITHIKAPDVESMFKDSNKVLGMALEVMAIPGNIGSRKKKHANNAPTNLADAVYENVKEPVSSVNKKVSTPKVDTPPWEWPDEDDNTQYESVPTTNNSSQYENLNTNPAVGSYIVDEPQPQVQVDQYGRPIQPRSNPNGIEYEDLSDFLRPNSNQRPGQMPGYNQPPGGAISQRIMSQPQQVDAWGRPIAPQPQQVDQWGRPITPSPQQVDAWGRPIAPQPQQVDQWGRPIAPPTQVDQWGRPIVTDPNHGNPFFK